MAKVQEDEYRDYQGEVSEEELARLGSLILVGGGVRILIRSGISRIENVPRSHPRTRTSKSGRGKCLDRVIDIDEDDRLQTGARLSLCPLRFQYHHVFDTHHPQLSRTSHVPIRASADYRSPCHPRFVA